MAEYAQANPEATEYVLRDEDEAQELLIAIVYQIKVMLDLTHDRPKHERRQLRHTERSYLDACRDGRALPFIQSMNDEEQLEIYGLKIVVPAVLVRQ